MNDEPTSSLLTHSEPMPVAARATLISSTALYALAGAIGKALALLTVPFFARTLSPYGYGLADLATAFAGVAVIVGSFSGDVAVARMYGTSRDPARRRRILGNYVFATATALCAFALGLLPFAGPLATAIWQTPDAESLVRLAILLIPLSGTELALRTVQRLEDHAGAYASIATLGLVAQLGFAVLFVVNGLGPQGLVLGLILGNTLGLLVSFVAGRRYVAWDLDFPLVRAIVMRGLPFLPSAVAFILADYIARAVAADRLGVDAVGELAIAIRLASVMALATAAFALAWGPRALSQPDNADTALRFGRLFRGFSAGTCGIALVVASFAPEIIHTAAGLAYSGAAQVLPGFMTASAVSGAYFVLTAAASVRNRGAAVASSATLGAVVQVAATVTAVGWLGIPALGVSALVGRLVGLIVLGWSVSPAVTGAKSSLSIWYAGAVIAGLLTFADVIAASFLVRAVIAAIVGVIGLALVTLTWSKGSDLPAS